MRNRFAVIVVGIVFLCGTGELFGQENWSYEVSPQVWFSGADGNTSFGDPYGDAVFALDFDTLSRPEIGGSASFVAKKGRWGYLFDFGYGRTPDGDADVALSALTGAATYELSSNEAKLDLVFGLRWSGIKTGVKVEVPEPDPDLGDEENFERKGGSNGWTDVVVGLRVVYPFSDRWAFKGQVDIGAGEGLSGNLLAGFDYAVSRSMGVEAGLRVKTGEHDDDNSDFDVRFVGPYVGVSWQY